MIFHYEKRTVKTAHSYWRLPGAVVVQDSIPIIMITCGEVPAGVFIAKDNGDGSFTVKLDYTTPAYRDCSAGKFIYNHLKMTGIKKILAETKIPVHEKYLHKMGFTQNGDSHKFVKEL